MQSLPSSSFKRSIVIAARVYAAFIVCWQIAINLGIREFWPIRLIDTFGAWLYLPLVLFLPSLIDRRLRQRLPLLLLIPCSIFIFEYHWCFFPKWDDSKPTAIKVMSWNVRYDNPSPDAIANTIRSERPDLVAIQELVKETAPGLTQNLSKEFPHHFIPPTFEFGIFSNYPIVSNIVRVASPLANREGAKFQEVEISIGKTPISVINVHLPTPQIKIKQLGFLPIPTDYNTIKQDESYAILIDRIYHIDRPLIVLGDFNTSDRDRNYRRSIESLNNSFHTKGWGLGFTYPTKSVWPIPLVRIDHIFHSQHWQTKAAWTHPGSGSDHQYLVAKLELISN